VRVDLGEDEDPEIGLIALIDCIFFLLMFFMVATTFKQQEAQRQSTQLPIELPQAEAALRGSVAQPAELAIGLDARGRLFLDGEPIGLQALHTRLAQAAAAQPRPRVSLEADRRTSYQHVVHIVDLCAAEGLTQVRLRTRS
jgi:biopolymer transport protein ExbD